MQTNETFNRASILSAEIRDLDRRLETLETEIGRVSMERRGAYLGLQAFREVIAPKLDTERNLTIQGVWVEQEMALQAVWQKHERECNRLMALRDDLRYMRDTKVRVVAQAN